MYLKAPSTTLFYFLFSYSFPQPTLEHYLRDSLTHLMLMTEFWSVSLVECLAGFELGTFQFLCSALTHCPSLLWWFAKVTEIREIKKIKYNKIIKKITAVFIKRVNLAEWANIRQKISLKFPSKIYASKMTRRGGWERIVSIQLSY